MKRVLVINGSPSMNNSRTMILTNAFLDGFKKKTPIEVHKLNLYEMKIEPCKCCLHCNYQNPGHCVIKDDVPGIQDMYYEADLVIWSFPIMFYSVPGVMKNLMDRFFAVLSPEFVCIDGEKCDHIYNRPLKKPCVVISSGGLNSYKNNYDGVRFMFDQIYSDLVSYVIVPGLILLEDVNTKYLFMPKFKKIRDAGYEYASEGKISDELQSQIWERICDSKDYVRIVNSRISLAWLSEFDKMQQLMDQAAAIYDIDEFKVREPMILEYFFRDTGLSCQLLLGDRCRVVCDKGQFEEADIVVDIEFDMLTNRKISDRQAEKGSELTKLLRIVDKALSKGIHRLKM